MLYIEYKLVGMKHSGQVRNDDSEFEGPKTHGLLGLDERWNVSPPPEAFPRGSLRAENKAASISDSPKHHNLPYRRDCPTIAKRHGP